MLDESNKKSYRLIVIIPWSSILRLISSLTIIILRKLSLVLSKERFSCASFSSVGNRYAAPWKHHFRVVFLWITTDLCMRNATIVRPKRLTLPSKTSYTASNSGAETTLKYQVSAPELHIRHSHISNLGAESG